MVCRLASLCLVVPALSASAFEFVVADARLDALFRMADLDGSGMIEAEEAFSEFSAARRRTASSSSTTLAPAST